MLHNLAIVDFFNLYAIGINAVVWSKKGPKI